jgi:DNA (cytosine-5)-methyltransferase 1
VRFGSVCSGIEAASVAWEPLGWKAAWYSQFDPDHNYKIGADFASAVLAHHYPDVPNLGDMTRIHDNETFKKEEIDILVGGTPCQSFSVAGFRKGLRDPRGGLALTFCEIAREKRPRWVIWENVPGVLSSNKGRDFGSFLGALADCGYSLAYRVLDAQYYGVPQRRRRVFVVGHLGGAGEECAGQVLFDKEGGVWNAPPRQAPPKLPLACSLEGLGWESTSGETARCLLTCVTGGRLAHETFLIDGDELDAVIESGWLDNPDAEEHTRPVPADEPGDEPFMRRLMPVECERLQGFPDDYTQIFYRNKPAEKCPDAPRYKALGNSIAVPVLRWIGERIAAIDGLPCTNVVQPPDPETVAKALSDSELVEKCVQGFRTLREIAPFLREARDRFAQPGRRVPVPGNPTWTEWVEANLRVTVRRVQQLLSEGAEPRETISLGSKRPRKLRCGDWRGLLKVTGRRNAQVFGSVEDPKRLAGTIRDFAQGIADQYARPGGKLVVSVSLKTRK